MTQSPFLARWIKPESVLLILFLGIIAWMPLPYGSNRVWAETVAATGLAALLLAWAGMVMSGVAAQTPLIREMKGPALCIATALAWGMMQSVDLDRVATLSGMDLSAVAHPVWKQARDTLGVNPGAFISADPAATRQALVTALLPVMAFLLAFSLGRDRTRAEVLSIGLVILGAGCALLAAISALAGMDLQGALLPEAPPAARGFAAPFINQEHLGALLALSALAAFGSFAERFRQAIVWDKGGAVMRTSLRRSLEGPDGAIAILGVCLLASLIATGAGVAIAAFAAGLLFLILALALGQAPDEPEARGRRATSAILVAVLGVTIAVGGDALRDHFGPPGLDGSDRRALAAATLRAIGEAPIVGQGLGAFASYHSIDAPLNARGTVEEASNDLLEPMADLGVPAGIAFMAAPLLIAMQCLSGAALRRRDRAFPAVAVAASMSMAVHAMAGFALQIPAVAVAFAVLLGIGAAQSWRTNMDLVR
jgi:hypothetical protein